MSHYFDRLNGYMIAGKMYPAGSYACEKAMMKHIEKLEKLYAASVQWHLEESGENWPREEIEQNIKNLAGL